MRERPAYNHTREDSALTPCPECAPAIPPAAEYGAAARRIASLTESSRRILADQEEMLSLLREASEAIEPFARMGAPSPNASDYARARDVLAKIAKALTS